MTAPGLAVCTLTLNHFRSYDALRLELSGAEAGRCVVLTGDNGAGKTNLLEALSLFTPGRGLRGADLAEMKHSAAAVRDTWSVAAEVRAATGERVRLGTGLDWEKKRRVVRIDGQDVKTLRALSDIFSVVWLTPAMDRLFLDGAVARRKFLDRLVFAAASGHVTRLNRYEKNMRERLRILQSGRSDDAWLSTLETQMAKDAAAIARARHALILQLAAPVADLARQAPLFPSPRLMLVGGAGEEEPALREAWHDGRARDRDAGRTFTGPHRADLQVFHVGKDMPADQCSTGEQKALLVSIVLAHALMMQDARGFAPLMLLDEVAAHLDEKRRHELFSVLSVLNGQIWLTGTDDAAFAALRGHAAFFRVEHGRVRS